MNAATAPAATRRTSERPVTTTRACHRARSKLRVGAPGADETIITRQGRRPTGFARRRRVGAAGGAGVGVSTTGTYAGVMRRIGITWASTVGPTIRRFRGIGSTYRGVRLAELIA